MGEVKYQVAVTVAGNRSVAIESDDPTIAQDSDNVLLVEQVVNSLECPEGIRLKQVNILGI